MRRCSIGSASLPPLAKDFVMSWRSAPAPGWARRYPVLAIRDFRLLLIDRLLGPFSVGFSIVGVSFAVLKVTGSTADLSYVIAAQTAPMLVFSLVSGVFADRFRPQRVIIAGNLAVVVGEGVFGAAHAGDRAPAAVGDDRPRGGQRDRRRHVLPGVAGAAPPARAGRAAAGGQLDQPARDEHGADDRRGGGGRARRGGRARVGADAVRARDVGDRPADAGRQGRAGAAARSRPARAPA